MPNIPVDSILPNPDQPRKHFDPEKLTALSASIKQQGVVQAITVEEHGDQYILEDGERRWRAAKLAGLSEIPATVNPARTGEDVNQRLERAMVANLHRTDINPIEEAFAYQRLTEAHGLSITAIARRLGVNYIRVKSRMAWLDLDPEIQELVAMGKLQKSPEVAEALLAIPDAGARIQVAKRLARKGISIRVIKNACRRISQELMQPLPSDGEDSEAAPPAVFFGKQRASRAWKPQIYLELVSLGTFPPWELLYTAAEQACNACSLSDIASPKICKECPAVELIASIVNISNDTRRKRP